MNVRTSWAATSFAAVALVAVATLGAWRSAPAPSAPLPTIHVVKSASCGCCTAWVEHLKKAGFTVTVENRDQFIDLKRKSGVTPQLESCHTAFVDGYVIEGHVPADLIKHLLATKPAGVKGLAVPGMPQGSPGMEGPTKERYVVYSFDAKSKATVYAER
jgi:hypothetical protein